MRSLFLKLQSQFSPSLSYGAAEIFNNLRLNQWPWVVDPRASSSMNKVIRRPRLKRFVKYGDDHAQPTNQVRPSYLRYMAVRTIECGVQIVLDYNAEHGSSLSVRIRGDEHSYGRLRPVYGRSRQRDGVFFTLH